MKEVIGFVVLLALIGAFTGGCQITINDQIYRLRFDYIDKD